MSEVTPPTTGGKNKPQPTKLAAPQLKRFRTTWPTGPTTTSMSIHEHPPLRHHYLMQKRTPVVNRGPAARATTATTYLSDFGVLDDFSDLNDLACLIGLVGRTTTMGQGACCSRAREVEPSSMPRKPPRPWEPTTSSWACFAASTSARMGRSRVITMSTSTLGYCSRRGARRSCSSWVCSSSTTFHSCCAAARPAREA